jgi:hypothetical protein
MRNPGGDRGIGLLLDRIARDIGIDIAQGIGDLGQRRADQPGRAPNRG